MDASTVTAAQLIEQSKPDLHKAAAVRVVIRSVMSVFHMDANELMLTYLLFAPLSQREFIAFVQRIDAPKRIRAFMQTVDPYETYPPIDIFKRVVAIYRELTKYT